MSTTSNEFGAGTHIEVKALSTALQAALSAVQYGKRDIEVVPTSSVSLNAASGFEGRRGFLMALNLETGEKATRLGGYGGANGFEYNAVDSTDEVYTLLKGKNVRHGVRY
jgi:hypothetical protein